MKDIDYSYEYDSKGDSKYCWPNGVLKNKFNIKDSDTLRKIEREITSARYYELECKGVTGDFSLKHMMKIHKFLFNDLYTWAGKIRTVDISKGTIFCLVQFIEIQFDELYEKLKSENFLADISSKDLFCNKIAYYLAEINMIHPFREGNGRTQRMYIEQLCKRNGRFEIDYSRADEGEMIDASIASAVGNNIPMEKLISKCIILK